MRRLISGAALSTVAAPALAAEFILSSTEVKSGSPMGLAQAFTACKLYWSGEPTGTQSRCTRTTGRAGWLLELLLRSNDKSPMRSSHTTGPTASASWFS